MKTLIIIIKDKKNKSLIDYEYELSELKNLINTYSSSSQFTELLVRIEKINPAFYIGSGKVEEIKNKILQDKIELVVINTPLTQTQQRNLKEIWQVDVIDKTFLILEIFKQRARSEEGKLQVELARLKYELSRLSGHGKTMDQQYGVRGVRAGSGERKIEYERRLLKEKISNLILKISNIKKTREIQRKKRLSVPMPIISIVGYTNAGKSTLLNLLSKRYDVYADNRLFATLDPTLRKVHIKDGFFGIFTDTVGFINNLPHLLISAFSHTLEEIKYSDLIIHLYDTTFDIEIQNMVVKKTLKEIEAIDIPLINVFNKVDLIKDIESLENKFKSLNPLLISAKDGKGIERLLEKVYEKLSFKWKERIIEIENIPQILNDIRKKYFVMDEIYQNGRVRLTLKITDENYTRLIKFIDNKDNKII